MRAFIIRPFGKKNDINFDDVETKLIDPALSRFKITGRTTMEIRRQGNIRVDMFQRLLTADLVIADISIHNANVYYELGVRHALRGKRTFLIRARGADVKTDEVPFDIKTDRYLTYNGADPAASLEDLIEGLRQTINSETVDSPIFQMLPDLAEQDRARFLPIPLDFREEVERAKDANELGDLELLGAETHGFEWETEGLRLVGRAQFSMKAFEGARATWEAVRNLDPSDVEANTLLGTIYERLGELKKSDQALKRVLARKGLYKDNRAEVHALLGRNAKTRWTRDWRNGTSLPERQRLALLSPFLDESRKTYEAARKEDLDHYYSCLNALAMLIIQCELAQLLPDAWADRFDNDEESRRELESREKQIQRLSAAAELCLKAAKERLEREGLSDIWVEIGTADLCFLTLNRPNRVADAYRRALADAPAFAIDVVRRQLRIYEELGLRQENVAAVLSMLGQAVNEQVSAPKRVLLFTGHMIDASTRKSPRFPNQKEKIEAAKQKIAEAVAAEQKLAGGIAYGVAGCASGGDILFHRVCEKMNIPTRILLALPRRLYVRESVAPAGPEWEDEFNRLTSSHPVRILGESKELPRWLQDKPNYDIWQRNNLWNLHNALAAAGGENVTLIALWNGVSGDGPGGTSDMVQKAGERGAKTIILDTNKIFTG